MLLCLFQRESLCWACSHPALTWGAGMLPLGSKVDETNHNLPASFGWLSNTDLEAVSDAHDLLFQIRRIAAHILERSVS